MLQASGFHVADGVSPRGMICAKGKDIREQIIMDTNTVEHLIRNFKIYVNYYVLERNGITAYGTAMSAIQSNLYPPSLADPSLYFFPHDPSSFLSPHLSSTHDTNESSLVVSSINCNKSG